MILLFDGYQYIKHTEYKNGQTRWSCAKWKNYRCKGVVNVMGNKACVKRPHSVCKKNEAANQISKALYDLKEKVCYENVSSISKEYRTTVAALKEAGVDESLIPTYNTVKSNLYLAMGKKKR